MTGRYRIILGATAREELLGARPFERRTLESAIEVHLTDQPDLASRRRKRLRPPPVELAAYVEAVFGGATPEMWNLRVGGWRVVYAVERATVYVLRIVKKGRATTGYALS